MSRNWLTQQLLPSSFWWFAIKRAVEVSNTLLLTYHIDAKHPKTPFEYVYNRKTDPRNLITLFSIADIKVEKEQGISHCNTFRSQTLRCITIGLSNKADCVLFYHPPSKQIIHAPTYKFDTFLPSSPQFQLAFDGEFIFNTRADLDSSIHRPTSHETNLTVYVTLPTDATPHQGIIVQQPVNKNTQPFTTIQLANNDIVNVMSSNISDFDPSASPSDIPPINTNPPHLQWIKDGAKVTMIPSDTLQPKLGYLMHLTLVPGEWDFVIGRKKQNPRIPLPKFEANIHSMLHNKKLFQNWKPLCLCTTARMLCILSNVTARHVSANDLTILKSPFLMKHNKLPHPDKVNWDAALQSLGTWEVISEEEYLRLHLALKTKALPTMAC